MTEIIDDTKTFTIALIEEKGIGEIVNIDYPASVNCGEVLDINAATKNIGNGSSAFVMELYIDGSMASRSTTFNLAAGATSEDKIPSVIAPSNGTSIDVAVKCIRIT